MTESEAIELGNKLYANITSNANNIIKTNDYIEFVKFAINALQKQIAKKPLNITKVKDGNKYIGLIGKCPCCNDIVDESNIVCDCGQKLNWESD